MHVFALNSPTVEYFFLNEHEYNTIWDKYLIDLLARSFSVVLGGTRACWLQGPAPRARVPLLSDSELLHSQFQVLAFPPHRAQPHFAVAYDVQTLYHIAGRCTWTGAFEAFLFVVDDINTEWLQTSSSSDGAGRPGTDSTKNNFIFSGFLESDRGWILRMMCEARITLSSKVFEVTRAKKLVAVWNQAYGLTIQFLTAVEKVHRLISSRFSMVQLWQHTYEFGWSRRERSRADLPNKVFTCPYLAYWYQGGFFPSEFSLSVNPKSDFSEVKVKLGDTVEFQKKLGILKIR